METAQIVWLVLVAVLVIVEASTVALVSIWFCLGAVVALIIALFWPQAIIAQVVVFVVVSAAMLLLLRPIARKLMPKKRQPTNADAKIGRLAQVTDAIYPGRFGRVKVDGLTWAAVCKEVIPVGSWCKVLAIEGVKLVVEPVASPEKELENSINGEDL